MIHDFDSMKKRYLDKLTEEDYTDKSKKGSVDTRMVPLIDAINSQDDLFTTSSCSGRIMLFVPAKRKCDVKWLSVTHDTADPVPLFTKLSTEVCKENDEVWYRMEGAILHVCCRTVQAAQKLIVDANSSGWKRAGIFTTTKRIMVEMICPEKIDALLYSDGKLLVDQKYIGEITKCANQRMESNWNRMKKLLDKLNS